MFSAFLNKLTETYENYLCMWKAKSTEYNKMEFLLSNQFLPQILPFPKIKIEIEYKFPKGIKVIAHLKLSQQLLN